MCPMNPALIARKNNLENPPVEKRGRPRKNTRQLCAYVSPETLKFLKYKARRKVTLGDVINRAVHLLEIESLLA